MRKRLFWIIGSLIGAVLLVIFICNLLVVCNASSKLYSDVEEVPHNKVGLVLGTTPITRWGTHNYYFDNRIQAADLLYKNGKIDTIIVSGGGDEPIVMRDSLINRGVSSDVIILDNEGQRTVKSIENAKNIYHLDSLTLVSQKFHNDRALYLTKHYDIDAVAFNAEEPKIQRSRLRNHVREYLARVKMFLELL